MGAFLGFISGVVFCYTLGIEQEILVRYGTYGITAAVSLFASGMALSASLAAIDNQNQINAASRRASLAASNATLPLIFSKLLSIGRSGAELCLGEKLPSGHLREKLKELHVADSMISELKLAIEYAEESNKHHLSNLIRSYQVLLARSEEWVTEADNPLLLNENDAGHWWIFCKQVESCYAYARGESDFINEKPDLSNPLGFFTVTLGISLPFYAQIAKTMEEFSSGERPPLFE